MYDMDGSNVMHVDTLHTSGNCTSSPSNRACTPNKKSIYLVHCVVCTLLFSGCTIYSSFHCCFCLLHLNVAEIDADRINGRMANMYTIPEDDFDTGIRHAMLHADLNQVFHITRKNNKCDIPDEDPQKVIRKSCLWFLL